MIYGRLEKTEMERLAHLQNLEREIVHMRNDLFQEVRTRLAVPESATVAFNVISAEIAQLEDAAE